MAQVERLYLMVMLPVCLFMLVAISAFNIALESRMQAKVISGSTNLTAFQGGRKTERFVAWFDFSPPLGQFLTQPNIKVTKHENYLILLTHNFFGGGRVPFRE